MVPRRHVRPQTVVLKFHIGLVNLEGLLGDGSIRLLLVKRSSNSFRVLRFGSFDGLACRGYRQQLHRLRYVIHTFLHTLVDFPLFLQKSLAIVQYIGTQKNLRLQLFCAHFH